MRVDAYGHHFRLTTTWSAIPGRAVCRAGWRRAAKAAERLQSGRLPVYLAHLAHATLMWIVKITGTLNRDPLLPSWLALLAQLGGGRVTVVCGSGSFGDEARLTHTHWRFDNDLHAHNMAVLAMAQTAYLASSLESRLHLASSEAGIRKILRAGHTAIWLPLDLIRERPDLDTSGRVTSDRIALDLAARLNAEHLVLVKSGQIDPAASVPELTRAGVLHRSFESMTGRASLPISVVQSDDLARVRALLHGDAKPISAV